MHTMSNDLHTLVRSLNVILGTASHELLGKALVQAIKRDPFLATRVSVEDLEEYPSLTMYFRRAAVDLGVTDNALFRAVMAHELPVHLKEIKRRLDMLHNSAKATLDRLGQPDLLDVVAYEVLQSFAHNQALLWTYETQLTQWEAIRSVEDLKEWVHLAEEARVAKQQELDNLHKQFASDRAEGLFKYHTVDAITRAGAAIQAWRGLKYDISDYFNRYEKKPSL